MPWSVQRQGDKWCVTKDSDGSTVACHDTEDEATAQLEALYAAEPSARRAGLAANFPLDPPRSWFFELPSWFEPNMKATVVTEGPEAGRFAATVANRQTCILNNSGSCWSAPESPSGYLDAMPGDTVLDDGSIIKTANLMLDVPHAPPHLSYEAAVRTMNVTDDTSKLGARVRYVDTEWGTVALGAVWPEASDLKIRKMQACTLSGDWRPRLEYGNLYDMSGSIWVGTPALPLPNRPQFRPVAASAGPLPVVFGGFDQEVPMPEVQSMTATCSGCGGLVSVPAQPARNQTVIVAAATEPCSCQARTAAEPPMPMMDEQQPSGDVVARADFEALLARVDALEAMFMGEQLAALDAQIAALPEVSPIA